MEDNLLFYRQQKGSFEVPAPKTILDVIKEEFPERYKEMIKRNPNKEKLFTSKEWLKILTKSRKSYEKYLKLSKKR